MFNVKSVCLALKKSKSLTFASKEKFLKSDGGKINHENMMKSNDEIPLLMAVRMKVCVSLGDFFLNEHIARKK